MVRRCLPGRVHEFESLPVSSCRRNIWHAVRGTTDHGGPGVGPGAAASVLFADGVVTANGGGQGYRVIGKGSRLAEGETITTGERSFAILEFADKSRTTLRPDTVLNIEQFRHVNAAESDGMLLRLLRGGVRAVTGLIGKGAPRGGEVRNRQRDDRHSRHAVRCTALRRCLRQRTSQDHRRADRAGTCGRCARRPAEGSQAKVLGKDGSTRTLAEGGAVPKPMSSRRAPRRWWRWPSMTMPVSRSIP